jgi:rod shape-determining protein MreC
MVGRRLLLLLLAVSIGHVLLISAQVQAKSGSPLIQAVSFDVFSSVQRGASAVADTGRGFWSTYVALGGAARENETLRARILELEGTIQHERSVAAQARSLEGLLAIKARSADRMLAARVVAGSPAPGTLTVTIDRGSDDGVAPDMAVVGPRGVVGRVIGPVSARAALVQLLIGRNAAIAATFQRSGAGGVLMGGAADGLLHSAYVPVLADVQVGETVLSSGQDRMYPPGFVIGQVERVEPVKGAEREIVVRSATDFSHVEAVLVVLERASRAAESSP